LRFHVWHDNLCFWMLLDHMQYLLMSLNLIVLQHSTRDWRQPLRILLHRALTWQLRKLVPQLISHRFLAEQFALSARTLRREVCRFVNTDEHHGLKLPRLLRLKPLVFLITLHNYNNQN